MATAPSSDPRTAAAVAAFEGRTRRPFPADKATNGLMGLLYPSEQVEWVGLGRDRTNGRDVVVALTDRRLVVSGDSWRVRFAAKNRSVVARPHLHGTILLAKAAFVPSIEVFVTGLSTAYLDRFSAQVPRVQVPLSPPPAPPRAHSAAPSPGWILTGEYTDPPPSRRSSQPARPPLINTWQDAEHFAAWHMRCIGFADAFVTASGVDGGIDVAATNAAAQVKYFETLTVSGPAVQQLRGAAHGRTWALFYASTRYTAAAVKYADESGVALFTYDQAGIVTPTSAAAIVLLRHGGTDTDTAPNPQRFADALADQRRAEADAARAQQVAQAAFDRAVAEFSVESRAILRAIPRARRRPGQRALAAVGAESNKVGKVIDAVGGKSIALRELLRHVRTIEASTKRIRAIRL